MLDPAKREQANGSDKKKRSSSGRRRRRRRNARIRLRKKKQANRGPHLRKAPMTPWRKQGKKSATSHKFRGKVANEKGGRSLHDASYEREKIPRDCRLLKEKKPQECSVKER